MKSTALNFYFTRIFRIVSDGGGVSFKAYCVTRDLGRRGLVPSVGVFLRNSSPYSREFRRKTTENSERLGQQARPGIEPGTSCLLIFERRTTLPLVGPRTDRLPSMPYPGFEPETFGVATGSPSRIV